MKRYSVTGLEARNAKSKCNHGHASSRSAGKRPFFASSSFACECSWSCGWTAPFASIVTFWFLFCSVAQLCPTLWLCGLQLAKPPCPSSSPEVCPSSCPLHRWCHPASHSLTPSSSALNLFPASGTFLMSQLFASVDQNTGASASALVLPKCIQGWFPLRLTGLISLLSKGLSGVFSSTTVRRHQLFDVLPSLQSSSHNHAWPLGRPQPWLYRPFVGRVICLLFNTLSRFVIIFLPRSNRLLIHGCSHHPQWF